MNPTAFWLNLHAPTISPRQHWDVRHLIAAMDDVGLDHHEGPTWPHAEPPACVVIAGAAHAGDEEVCFRAVVDAYDLANIAVEDTPNLLTILVSDEESLFKWWDYADVFMGLWVCTPRMDVHEPLIDRARFFGEGPGPTPEGGWPHSTDKTWDVFWAGQDTHSRRHELVSVLRKMDGAVRCETTDGFMQGRSRDQYLDMLARTKIAPCPSGPGTADSFRLYEAIECGAVPVVERYTPDGVDHGMWGLVYGWDDENRRGTHGLGEDVPFPVLDDWSLLPGVVDDLLTDDRWSDVAEECQMWWKQQCETMRANLRTDLGLLP